MNSFRNVNLLSVLKYATNVAYFRKFFQIKNKLFLIRYKCDGIYTSLTNFLPT